MLEQQGLRVVFKEGVTDRQAESLLCNIEQDYPYLVERVERLTIYIDPNQTVSGPKREE